MDYWRLVTKTESVPPITAPPRVGSARTAAVVVIKVAWVKKRDRAAALLITSISDEELHTVQAVDEDPVAI